MRLTTTQLVHFRFCQCRRIFLVDSLVARGLLGYPSFLVSIVHVPVPLDKLYQRKPFDLGRHVAILGSPDWGDVHGRNCCICCCGLCRHLGIVVLRADVAGTIYIIGTCRLRSIYHPLLLV